MRRQLFFRFITGIILSTVFLPSIQAQVEYGVSRSLRIYTPNFKPYTDIQGSPFIPGDSVQNGWLLNGTKRIPVRLRYNSYTGEVEYVEGSNILTPANSITEFAILAPDTMYFHRGFPGVESKTAANFYQILFNGRKTKLLKHVFANVKSNSERMSEDFGKREFQKHEEYYVWIANTRPPAENYFEKLSEGIMKAATPSKKSLLSLFPENAERINQYVADKKMKLKSWAEFTSVLTYLEAL